MIYIRYTGDLLIKATEGSSGYDLKSITKITLEPNIPKRIKTGINLELIEGYEGQIRSRSGLSSKGIIVANSPGTIDQDFRGEIEVVLINLGKEIYIIEQGDKIAQLVICALPEIILINSPYPLGNTTRGEKGFGSTGI
jgi:dUTP pyrophosphatase